MITKLNNRELFQFCEQFSIILRSGMSAIEGLAILNDDSQTERGKEILTFLYKDMEESGSLAHAMEQSGAFPASAAAVMQKRCSAEQDISQTTLRFSMQSRQYPNVHVQTPDRAKYTAPLAQIAQLKFVLQK